MAVVPLEITDKAFSKNTNPNKTMKVGIILWCMQEHFLSV